MEFYVQEQLTAGQYSDKNGTCYLRGVTQENLKSHIRFSQLGDDLPIPRDCVSQCRGCLPIYTKQTVLPLENASMRQLCKIYASVDHSFIFQCKEKMQDLIHNEYQTQFITKTITILIYLQYWSSYDETKISPCSMNVSKLYIPSVYTYT